MFTQKSSGHGSWESLNSHWLRVSRSLALGLHEGNFRLQPTTFWVHGKSNGIPHGKYVEGLRASFLGRLFCLKVCRLECAVGFGFTLRACDLQKPHGLLYALIEKVGYCVHLEPWPNAFNVNCPYIPKRPTQKHWCLLISPWDNCGNNTN